MIKLNNKGFTLTEVLAVIIVLIAILTISLPDLSSTVETVKKEDVSSGITSYAELYLSDNLDAIKKHMSGETSCYIEVSDLYDYGYKVKESDDQYVVYNFSNLEFNSVNSIEGISKCDISIDDLDNIGSGEELDSYVEVNADKFNLYNNVKIGDYVKMTPVGSEFKVPSDWSGGVTIFNLHPNELDVWRVIKKNSDNTIEMISNNNSSGTVQFKGVDAYKKYVYYLNEIAKQYENKEFTVRESIRHLGYQSGCSVDVVVNDKFNDDSYRVSPPNTLSKNAGGSDDCYTYDFSLIENINNVITDKINLGIKVWLASRDYYIGSYDYWCGRALNSSGNLYSGVIFSSRYTSYGGGNLSVRPIITLKNDVTYINEDANGTSEKPYILG